MGGKNQNPKNSLDQMLTPIKSHSKFVKPSLGEFFFWRTTLPPQIFRLFWIPQKSLLKSIHPRKYSPIFLPKKIPELKLSNPKESFDHPHHLKFSRWCTTQHGGPQWSQLGVLQRPGTFLAPFYLVLSFLSFYLDIQLRRLVQPAALFEIEVYYFTLGQENPVDGYDRDCHHFIISFQSVASFFGCFASHVNCDWCI